MSNHVHLVLHVDVLKAQGWSDKQVLALWHTVYKGTLLTQKFMQDETLSQAELISLNETIEIYRKRQSNYYGWPIKVYYNLNRTTALLTGFNVDVKNTFKSLRLCAQWFAIDWCFCARVFSCPVGKACLVLFRKAGVIVTRCRLFGGGPPRTNTP
jgi:hypothetical protein